MKCTFFGHRDIFEDIEERLKSVLIELIENKNVELFYVGNQGDFDYIVRKNLEVLKKYYPHINYVIVLAYMPNKKYKSFCEGVDTVFPEGLENVPPKYAINKRNTWMVNNSDYVVTYVKYSVGGAAEFKSLSEKKGKIVININ